MIFSRVARSLSSDVGRDRIAIEVGGHVSSNVHRDVVGNGLAGGVGDDEDANLRGQVGVGLVQVEVDVLALDAHDATNLELLADDGGESIQTILDGARRPWGRRAARPGRQRRTQRRQRGPRWRSR